MIITLNIMAIEEKYLNMIKAIYNEPTANFILIVKNSKPFL